MSAKRSKYDLLVIGSGPAGIHAAVQAAKLNKTVGIIEKTPERIGGAWLHTGTIPSKTVREVLDAVQNVKPHIGKHWLDRIVNNLSSGHLWRRAISVSKQEENLVRKHLDGNNIEIITGFGRIEDEKTVRVTKPDGEAFLLKTEITMIATGSIPRRPANIPFDDWRVVDSDGILKLESLPRSIMIFGAGVIGCEYACIFGALGVNTTLIDQRAQIMQSIDKEIAETLKESMEEMGIKFLLGCEVKSIRTDGPEVIGLVNGEEVRADVFFFAAGRESATRQLGLERVGIEVNSRGTILVNQYFQTQVPTIFAAGDAIGAPALASTSAEQGRIAACHAFGAPHHEFPKIFPIGVYTIPELSSVGKSEQELNQEGVDYVVGRASFDEVARGYIRGDNHGLLKLLVCARSEKLLGIHIIGNDAANLIHIGLCCMLAGMPLRELVNNIIFNYPTLAEAYRVAAFNALNKLLPNANISNLRGSAIDEEDDDQEAKEKTENAA